MDLIGYNLKNPTASEVLQANFHLIEIKCPLWLNVCYVHTTQDIFSNCFSDKAIEVTQSLL